VLLAGQWALVSDEEQDADWMVVECDGQLPMTFVRRSAMEDHPGEVASSVVETVLRSFQSPPPGSRRRPAAAA